jgi:hypothetical protein
MGDFRRRLTTDPSGFTLLPNQTSFTLASFYITCFSLTDFVFLTFLLPFLFSNPLGLHSSSSVNGSWFVSGTIYIYGLNYITEYNHDASLMGQWPMPHPSIHAAPDVGSSAPSHRLALPSSTNVHSSSTLYIIPTLPNIIPAIARETRECESEGSSAMLGSGKA